MPFLQDLVHRAGLISGSRLLKFVLAALAWILLALAYDLRAWRNLPAAEGMDAAQLARHIAEGKGYTTSFVRPFSLALVEKRSGHPAQTLAAGATNVPAAPQRDISNPPVYPFVLAGVMKALPFHYAVDLKHAFWSLPDEAVSGERKFWRYQPDFLITLFNQLLFGLVVLAAFLWARRWFDTGVAWMSALVLAGTELLWRFSASGLSTLLLLLIFLGLAWCLALLEVEVREKKSGPGRAFALAAAAGVLVGLGGLTRYAFVWLMLPAGVFVVLFTDSRRVALCLTALAGFAAVMAPWMIRNWNLSGAVFGTATFDLWKETALFPGDHLDRSLNPHFQTLPRLLWFKAIANARLMFQSDLFHAGGGWITGLFLAGLLVPFRNPTLRRMRYFVLGSLAVLFVAQALGRTQLSEDSPAVNSENLLVLLIPLVVVYAVSLFFLLLDPIPVKLPAPELRYVVFTVFGALASLPLILTLISPATGPVVYPPYYPPQIQQVAGWMGEREAIMSDIPWAVAWYGNRPSVWLTLNATPNAIDPDSPENLFALARHYPVSGLYLTPKTTDGRFLTDLIDSGESGWGNFALDVMTKHEVPLAFPLNEMPVGLSPRAILLADRKRW